MRRSIRNFNTPPPPSIAPAFDCGRGEFERCVGRVGNLNRIYLLFCAREFFPFLQGLTDLQNRISPLFVNNSFKRVFKRSFKVSLRHIPLWKACKVFDWRRNWSLRRGSSVLTGGEFERLFCPRGGNLNNPIFNSSNARGEGGCWTFELIGA